MKKIRLISSLLLVLGTTFVASSCGGGNESEVPGGNETYNVTIETSNYYEIKLDKTSFEKDEKVSFGFEMKTMLHNFEGIFFNDTKISDALNSRYSFNMPAEDVKIKVQLSEKEDVKEDGDISWSGMNFTVVPTTEESEYVFPINIKWNNTTSIDHTIQILDESVFPSSAVTFKPVTGSGSSLIRGGELKIDGKGLKAGKTKIAISLKSKNTSNKGTIIQTFEVADKIELETMTETLEFDTSDINSDDAKNLKMQLKDLDYVEGSDTDKYIQEALANMTDNKFTFDYIVGHRYEIYVYTLVNGIETGYRVADSIASGSTATGFNQCKNEVISFVDPNVTLKITVLEK